MLQILSVIFGAKKCFFVSCDLLAVRGHFFFHITYPVGSPTFAGMTVQPSPVIASGIPSAAAGSPIISPAAIGCTDWTSASIRPGGAGEGPGCYTVPVTSWPGIWACADS